LLTRCREHRRAIHEDLAIIEAQQKVFDADPNLQLLAIGAAGGRAMSPDKGWELRLIWRKSTVSTSSVVGGEALAVVLIGETIDRWQKKPG
jgi:hypothetical protein